MPIAISRYSLAVLAASVAIIPGAKATTQFSVIASVAGAPQIGAVKGNTLYGTVPYSNGTVGYGGDGTVFSVTTTGTYTLLHIFDADVDGSAPNAQLAIDTAGDVFGTAANGGVNGAGTIWEYSAAHVMSTPHAFGTGSDGTHPFQGPTLGPKSAILGATSQGAINDNGMIFSLSTKGAYSVVYQFLSGMDGHCPFSGVAVSSSSIIYGTTVGINTGGNPNGSIYKFTAASGFKTAYVFKDGSDGEWPDQTPVLDGSGNIYGTTHKQNGASFAGAVWKISAAGKFTVLYDLHGATDGFEPNSPLLLNTDGNLYGTTSSGGADNYGTVFRITKAGKFTLLHSFTAGADGAQPTGNLVHDSTGNVYGGTAWGTIFKIKP